jgi:hypothetical protein
MGKLPVLRLRSPENGNSHVSNIQNAKTTNSNPPHFLPILTDVAKIVDGPLARHANEIAELETHTGKFAADISRKNYSTFRKAQTEEIKRSWPPSIENVTIEQVIMLPPAINMSSLLGKWINDQIEPAVELFYVNSEM